MNSMPYITPNYTKLININNEQISNGAVDNTVYTITNIAKNSVDRVGNLNT
jgi:hypothetical protein